MPRLIPWIFLLMFACILLLTGCSMDAGEPTAETKAKTIACTDTRDGEKFTFEGSTIKNSRTHYDGNSTDTCFDITDTTGKKRNLCGRMEMYLKCEEVQK